MAIRKITRLAFPTIAFTLFTMVLVSCMEDYQLAYEGDQLVVNSILENGERISVNLSHSQNPSGTIVSPVDVLGASVLLFKNGEYIESLKEVGKGGYLSNFEPDSLDSYHFEIEAEGYSELKTTPEKLPSPFPLVSYHFEAVENTDSRPSYLMDLVIKDPLGAGDYYEINVYGYRVSIGEQWILGDIKGAAGIGDVPCVWYNEESGAMIHDECFDGQNYRIRLEFRQGRYFRLAENSEYLTFESFRISLRKVSPSYYQYRLTSLIPEGFENAFFEPKILYSNVTGGYGIAAAYNQTDVIFNP